MTAPVAIARVAWLVPLSLLLLSLHQAKAARDLGVTLERGEEAVAEVTRYLRSDRKDVTQAEVDLRVTLADGSTLVHDRLALPYSVAHRVEAESLAVRVIPGAAQEIVIVEIGPTQRRIALSNAAMSAVMLIMASIGVFAWNRQVGRNKEA